MSVRIRYKQVTPGIYESVQIFLTKDGVSLKPGYDSNLKELFINAVGIDTVVRSPYTNLHAAKITLKRLLREAGITFTDEVRRKKE